MRARDHTTSMLRWWRVVGISQADLAIRRRDSTMIWHREVDLAVLATALHWARAENAGGADVYIRPARAHSWPVVYLDDVPLATALLVTRKYDCLAVSTSPPGGCHLWLRCDHPLDEEQRRQAQRWLAPRAQADPASTSGEHLGRLAGFKNWKRGCWVNVVRSVLHQRTWIPSFADDSTPAARPDLQSSSRTSRHDTSPSGREWGWVCGLLEAGCDPTTAYQQLVQVSGRRRGSDAERYAQRTVARALAHIGARATTREPRERRLTERPS